MSARIKKPVKKKRPKRIDLTTKVTWIAPLVAETFECGICLSTIKNAVAICESHIFCEQCVALLMYHNGSDITNIVICPTCRKPVARSTIKRMVFIDRQIGNLMVKCPNHEITPQKALYLQQCAESNHNQDDSDWNRNHNSNRNQNRESRDGSISRSRSRSRSRDRFKINHIQFFFRNMSSFLVQKHCNCTKYKGI